MRSVNFEFLQERWPSLFHELSCAERELHTKTDITRLRMRRASEAITNEILDKLDIRVDDKEELHAKIQLIGSRIGWPKFASPLNEIRKRCNPAAHELPETPSSRGINETIDLLESVHGVLVNWLRRAEPNLDVPRYTEPPRVPSLEMNNEDLERVIREHQRLVEEKERRESIDREVATIWEGDDVAIARFQKMTHQQVGRYVESEDVPREYLAAFGQAFQPAAAVDERVSVVQEELLEAQEQLEEEKEKLGDERRRLDADHARRVADLEIREAEVLGRREWTADYPSGDWSKIPAFFEERLRKGLPPFESWLMPPGEIGSGSHGRVYRCYPSSGGVPVAVKIPRESGDPESVRRAWEWEINAATQLAMASSQQLIEGVPRPLAISPRSQPGFIVYELVDGVTLRETIRGRSIHPRRALHLIDRIQSTLQRLMDADIRFTDVADRNVMIQRDGQPVLVDLAPCIASEANPPEWSDQTRFSGTASEIRSGHYFMLGMLLLRMLGIAGRRQPRRDFGLSSMDFALESAEPESDQLLMERQRAAIRDACLGIPGFDADGLADLLEDCCFRVEVRRNMHPRAFVKTIRGLYDPGGIIESISAGS